MNYSILKKKKTISSKEYFYSNFIEKETKQLFQVHQLSNKEDSIQKSGGVFYAINHCIKLGPLPIDRG